MAFFCRPVLACAFASSAWLLDPKTTTFLSRANCSNSMKKWTHWDWNPGPSACEADVMPLHHEPSGEPSECHCWQRMFHGSCKIPQSARAKRRPGAQPLRNPAENVQVSCARAIEPRRLLESMQTEQRPAWKLCSELSYALEESRASSRQACATTWGGGPLGSSCSAAFASPVQSADRETFPCRQRARGFS